jgi:hypothetical protein
MTISTRTKRVSRLVTPAEARSPLLRAVRILRFDPAARGRDAGLSFMVRVVALGFELLRQEAVPRDHQQQTSAVTQLKRSAVDAFGDEDDGANKRYQSGATGW